MVPTSDNMKLVAFCLLAFCCCTFAAPADIKRNKLRETLFELGKFNQTLTSMERMVKRVNTPPNTFEQDCGCVAALRCFQKGISTFNFSTPQFKLSRSLNNPNTIEGLRFCDKDSTPSCGDCKALPTKSVDEFLNQLESLLQMGIAKLSMG